MFATDVLPSEYHKFYHSYIKVAGEDELITALERGRDDFVAFLKAIPVGKLSYSYASNKWTIAEVVQHLIDAERVFQYRALRFARNDDTPLPGFDQDSYVPQSRANERTGDAICEEFVAVRNSTLALFKSFNEEELLRIGTASDAPMSVRALGFVICGHQAHHKKIIAERYL